MWIRFYNLCKFVDNLSSSQKHIAEREKRCFIAGDIVVK